MVLLGAVFVSGGMLTRRYHMPMGGQSLCLLCSPSGLSALILLFPFILPFFFHWLCALLPDAYDMCTCSALLVRSRFTAAALSA